MVVKSVVKVGCKCGWKSWLEKSLQKFVVKVVVKVKAIGSENVYLPTLGKWLQWPVKAMTSLADDGPGAKIAQANRGADIGPTSVCYLGSHIYHFPIL